MGQKERQAKFEEFKKKFNTIEDFKKKVIADPTKTFFDFVGEPVPEKFKLKVDKHTDGSYQIMPVDVSGIKLSDESLDKITGGNSNSWGDSNSWGGCGHIDRGDIHLKAVGDNPQGWDSHRK